MKKTLLALSITTCLGITACSPKPAEQAQQPAPAESAAEASSQVAQARQKHFRVSFGEQLQKFITTLTTTVLVMIGVKQPRLFLGVLMVLFLVILEDTYLITVKALLQMILVVQQKDLWNVLLIA